MEFILNYEGEEINELLGKAKTALQSVPSEYVTDTELNNKGYLTEHQDISGKQDKIADLETIRSNASKGATALQSVPDGYVTEGELESKGYATASALDQKQNAIEDLDEIRENASKINNVLGEDGYVYSNGEKVDMRFTRSLLPVGTSIPANSNLNTKTYLKIGKYYCSLNVDAKTITNCPTSEAFSMEVFNPLGTNVDDEDTREYTYRLRVLTAYKTGVQYIQYCATSGTAGSWTYNGWFVVPRTSFSLASSKNGGTAAKGASNRGVYIDSTGTFQQMGYTVAKSVPSNAVFTDTNTKVTSVDNHYAPAEDTDAELSAPDGEVVVGIKRDAAGHVVGLATALGGGSSATPDWDASDGQEGHILNRTHYVNGSFVEMESIGKTDEDVWFGNDGIARDLMLVRLQLGEESIEFTIEYSSSKEIVLGGKTMEFCYISSSEVCVYGENLYDLRCFINDYVVNEQSYSQLIKQLDEKFIPSTIARKSDIDNAIAAAITNVLNTPV